LLAAAALSALTLPVQADKADRNQPMVVEADRSGTVDLQRQILVYSGNVVISQGSMLLRADRVELRETPDGYRAATATGAPGKPATWRQRREGSDEIVEGGAERIEFDGKADTLRLVGNSSVRRLRGGQVADEITGGSIVWDNLNEVFKVEGGAATAVNPSGRVRAVLSPRAEPGSGAAPAAPTAPLAPSRTLGQPAPGGRR
jgi:lipopolysaccharide export system protein LptA